MLYFNSRIQLQGHSESGGGKNALKTHQMGHPGPITAHFTAFYFISFIFFPGFRAFLVHPLFYCPCSRSSLHLSDANLNSLR